jgi:hypothetical protein
MPTDDVRRLFIAANPSKTLDFGNSEDRQYYIDFSSVTGNTAEELKDLIVAFPAEPTCSLFTGHIGSGKSTELLRLKDALEQEGFHVIYFESSEDLEMADVDIGDLLLMIARKVSEDIEKLNLEIEADGFRELVKSAKKLLLNSVETQGNVWISSPSKAFVGFGDVVAANSSSHTEKSLLSIEISQLSIGAKNDSTLRERLNQYLGPQKHKLLSLINKELIEPAIIKLNEKGIKGLVIVVDNLDRIDSRSKTFGRPQHEYIFIDQSEVLTGLRCHTIYTMPLSLRFSNEYPILTQRFGGNEPYFLPMVPVFLQNGDPYDDGLSLLKQAVLARAFPSLKPEQRLANVLEVFDSPQTLDRLCYISGGHLRDLIRLGCVSHPLEKNRLQLVIEISTTMS